MTAITPAAAHDLVLILWSLIVGIIVGLAFGVALARSLRPRVRPTPPVAPVTAVLPRVETPRVETPTVQFVRVPAHVITTQPERQQPHVWHYGGRSHATHNGGTR